MPRTFLLLFITLAFTPIQAQSIPDCEEALAILDKAKTSDNLEATIAAYQALANCYQSKDNLGKWMYTLWNLQNLQYANTEKALAWVDTALHFAWRTVETPYEFKQLFFTEVNHGYLLTNKGNILASTRAFEHAIDIYKRQAAAPIDVGIVLNSVYKPLGNNYTRLGDYEKAILFFSEAIDLAKNENIEGEQLAGLYNNLGITLWSKQEYFKADSIFSIGLTVPDLPLLQRAFLECARADNALSLGKTAAARLMLNKSTSALNKIPNAEDKPWVQELKARQIKLSAQIAAANNETQTAQDLYGQAIEQANNSGSNVVRLSAKIWVNKGQLAQQSGQYQQAISFYDSALHVMIPSFKPKEGDLWPAINQLFAENTLVDAFAGKASCFSKENNFEEALNAYQYAFLAERKLWEVFLFENSRLELQRQSHLLSEAALEVAYQWYKQSQDQKVIDRALAIIENNRAVLLKEAAQAAAANSSAKTSKLLLQTQELRQELIFLDYQYAQSPSPELAAEREKISSLLARSLHDLYAIPQEGFATSFQNENIVTAQKKMIDKESSLLEYFWGDDWLFVVKIPHQGKASFYKQAITADHFTSLQKYVNLLMDRNAVANNPSLFLQSAFSQYELWLAPFYENEQSLILALDGPLQYLSFNALVTSMPSGLSLHSADYLLLKTRIRQIYSLGIELSRSGIPDYDLVFSGWAPFAYQDIRGLPQLSTDELTSVQKSSNIMFLGEQATLARLFDPKNQARILHLSTHAFAGKQGDLPRIELYDKPLYIHDIYQQKFPVELVVLSACQTNLGELAIGEGVLSLSRAFSYSGARSIIASQWSVNAKATSQLFKYFYKHLAQTENRSISLQAAQKDWLKDTSIPDWQKSPHYWAGFVLIGEDIPMKGIKKELGSSFFSITMIITLSFSGIVFYLVFLWLTKRSNKAL